MPICINSQDNNSFFFSSSEGGAGSFQLKPAYTDWPWMQADCTRAAGNCLPSYLCMKLQGSSACLAQVISLIGWLQLVKSFFFILL